MSESNRDMKTVCEIIPEDPLSRRNFLKGVIGCAAGVYAAAAAYPVYRYLAAPAEKAAEMAAVKEVSLAKADELPPGSSMMFRFGSKPALLIHHADGSWAAFSAVCTHLACTVSYEQDKKRIHCACHGGVYDPKTGANIAGPPPKPLTRFKVDVAPGHVIVSREA